MKKRYIADFETLILTDEQIKNNERTYVWAWALCDCDTLDTVYGTDITSFFETISKLKNNSEVWFHNLKYDGQFIVDFLLNHKWTQKEIRKGMKATTFTSLVSSIGVWYSIELCFGKNKVLILDSLKKLPFKVEAIAKALKMPELKGSIDYTAYRKEGGVLSDEDKDYIRRDVQIVARAMKSLYFDKKLDARTIGSDCLEFYKNMTPNFRLLFPKITEKEDEYLRNAYSGGIVLVNPKIAGKIQEKNGLVLDINSMYPFVMHSKSKYKYPIGKPIYFKGAYTYDPRHKLYVQRFRAAFKLKENKMPFIHSSQGGLFRDMQYITDTKGEMIELTLTSIDLELFFNHYDVEQLELIDGYKFESSCGLFDKYIDYFYNMKAQAKENNNPVEYLQAKLFLNNLGGKFAQSGTVSNKHFYLDDNNIIKSNNSYSTADTNYIPVAAFMTAYARRELFNVIDQNMDHFCYCDTDSVHLNTNIVNGNINIDDYELGAWKKESTWTKAIFLRPKTYAEYIDDNWKITGCGMNEKIKEQVKEKGIEHFKIGAKYTGKIHTNHVPGGVVLTETLFEIRK